MADVHVLFLDNIEDFFKVFLIISGIIDNLIDLF
jgi:hypothetical protein